MAGTIAPEIVACIARGGQPSETELERVAKRIRCDLETALGCGRWPGPSARDRVATEAIRVARAALEGVP